MINQVSTMVTGGWRESSDYARVLDHLQKAEWSEAVGILMYMINDYPGDADLQALLADTQLRLETETMGRGHGPRLPFVNRRVMFIGALVGVLIALGALAYFVYNGVVVPSLRETASVTRQRALADEAQQALAAGDFDKAIFVYDQLAAINPNHASLTGRQQATQGRDLEGAYDLAQEQLAAGALADAQATLIGIQKISPTYRDVGTLLLTIERKQRMSGLMREAAAGIDGQNWQDVVTRLEQARAIAAPNEQGSLEADLFDAYMNLAGQIVAAADGKPVEMQRAVDLYNKALALKPQEPAASARRNWGQDYLNGYQDVKAGNWEDAIAELQAVYSEQPDYQNGHAAQMLYDAYMAAGDALFAANKPELAWERYYRASQLKGPNTSTAQALAGNLAYKVTPTPPPPPAPTATPVPLAQRQQAGSPAAGSGSLTQYKNKIAFLRTENNVSTIWVMDPDGKNAVRMQNQEQAQTDYRKLREAETRSPDGNKSLQMVTPENSTYAQVYVAGADGTGTKLTDLEGMNGDPIWSPTGYWVAFVSSQPGNDEIFTVGNDGAHLTRLTNNTWEWDKHPSWSAKGDQLVFWSNRGNRPQIWIMNADGSGQKNISNNTNDERDPIWIK